MTTRSKSKNCEVIINEIINTKDDDDFVDDIDEYGNLKGFIDYGSNEDLNSDIMNEFNKQLYIISNGSDKYKRSTVHYKHRKKKINKNEKNEKNLSNIVMSYLIMKATEKANEELNTKKIKKIKKHKKNDHNVVNEIIQNIELIREEEQIENNSNDNGSYYDSIELNQLKKDENYNRNETEDTKDTKEFEEVKEVDDSEESSESEDFSETDETDESEESEESERTDGIDEIDEIDETEEEEYLFEYDEFDEKYEEIMDQNSNQSSEDYDIEYFHTLSTEMKQKLIEDTKKIYEINEKNIPLRFKVIHSNMDLKTKAIAINNIDKLVNMDVSTGEYSKMDHWINGLIKIPFGIYKNLPVVPEDSSEKKRKFIHQTYEILDKAIYGHSEAKTHILQVIGKWIKNPKSGGNVLAIQGPMGNGKTTLVKDGISKILNRPFAFIALGGASDSAYFDGHCYTYEGSHWGRIVQIIQDSKCMNPIIYFDELDKISDTQKGDEIVHMLTHLTDPSQNSLFQDNYFPGINLDLSKVLFIFSYNDETKINKILKDRMYVIHTKGFQIEDKLNITRNYLLPELMNVFNFNRNDIIFTDEIIKEIINLYTQKEEGVRNLKRCIETIISKINIYMLSYSENESTETNEIIKNKLSFQLKDFQFPIQLTKDHIQVLLRQENSNMPPFHMYL